MSTIFHALYMPATSIIYVCYIIKGGLKLGAEYFNTHAYGIAKDNIQE